MKKRGGNTPFPHFSTALVSFKVIAACIQNKGGLARMGKVRWWNEEVEFDVVERLQGEKKEEWGSNLGMCSEKEKNTKKSAVLFYAKIRCRPAKISYYI